MGTRAAADDDGEQQNVKAAPSPARWKTHPTMGRVREAGAGRLRPEKKGGKKVLEDTKNVVQLEYLRAQDPLRTTVRLFLRSRKNKPSI